MKDPKFKSLKEYYNQERDYYSKTNEDWFRFESFSKALNLNNANYLDLGCAEGEYLSYALNENTKLSVGIDISLKKLEKANFRFGIPDLITANSQNLPLRKNSFDIITSFEMLEHVPNPKKVIKECYDLLKEGGSLFIGVPIEKNFWKLNPKVDKQEDILNGNSRFWSHLHSFNIKWFNDAFKQFEGYVSLIEGSPINFPFSNLIRKITGINLGKIFSRFFPSISSHIIIKFVKLTSKAPAVIKRKCNDGILIYLGYKAGYRLNPKTKRRYAWQAKVKEESGQILKSAIPLSNGKCLILEDYPWWTSLTGYKGWMEYMNSLGFECNHTPSSCLNKLIKEFKPNIIIGSGESWPGNIPSLHLSEKIQNIIIDFVKQGNIFIADSSILHRNASNEILCDAFGVNPGAEITLASFDHSPKNQNISNLKVNNIIPIQKEKYVIPQVVSDDVKILSIIKN